jgi:threonine dehydrogenase-like Zn-dependent dehydrogenase
VIIVDVLEHRLEFAQRIGANHVLLADRSSISESTAKDIRKIYPKGCDASIECSGDEHAMQTALMVSTR